jgi:hypothetical protein
MKRQLLFMCILLLFVGCGGGDDGDGNSTTTTPTQTTTTPTTSTPTTTQTTGQIKSLVIESAQSVQIPATSIFPAECHLRVSVRNTSNQTNVFALTYNAFNAAGNGIATTIVSTPSQTIPPNSGSVPIEIAWGSGTRSPLRDCTQIASFRLDTNPANTFVQF